MQGVSPIVTPRRTIGRLNIAAEPRPGSLLHALAPSPCPQRTIRLDSDCGNTMVSFPSIPSHRPRVKNWLLLAHGPSAHTTGPRLLGLGVQPTRSLTLAATLPPGLVPQCFLSIDKRDRTTAKLQVSPTPTRILLVHRCSHVSFRVFKSFSVRQITRADVLKLEV